MQLRTALLIGAGAAVVLGGAFVLSWRARPAARPAVVLVTVSADGAPSRMESDVTVPIEHALAGLPGLARLRSESRDGRASIACTFAGVPDLEAAARVRAAVEGSLARLPADASPPVVSRVVSNGPPLWVTGDAELRRELETVPGVERVEACGERRQRLVVVLDLGRLSARGAEIGDVVHALRDASPRTLLPSAPEPPEPSAIGRVSFPARGAEARVDDVAVVERRDEQTGCTAVLGPDEREHAMLLGVYPRADAARGAVVEAALSRARERGARARDPARTLSVGFFLPRAGDIAERGQAARALVERVHTIDGARGVADVAAVVRADGAGDLLMTVEPSKESAARAVSRDALRALPGVAYGGVTASPRGQVPSRLLVVARGPDLADLAAQDARARELRARVVAVPGVGLFVGRDQGSGPPEITATIDRAAVAAAGTSPPAVAEAIRVVLHGVEAGPVFVTAGARDPRLLEAATIAGRPLTSLVRVVMSSEPAAIVRVDRERALELRWEVERDVTRDVARALADPSITVELEAPPR